MGAAIPFVVGVGLLVAERAPGVAWPLIVFGAGLASILIAPRGKDEYSDERRAAGSRGR